MEKAQQQKETKENRRKLYGIRIIATGRALPEQLVSNEKLSETVDTDDAWIRSRTGIGQRYLCEGESCNSLAIEAAQKAVMKAKDMDMDFAIDEVGVVVVATTSADNALPSTACMVQKALGCSTQVMAFDINAACSGFLYGIQLCQGLLHAGKGKYAVLIGSEQLSRITDFTDRATCVLFGDGAGAAVVSLDENGEHPFCGKAWADGNDEALYCKGAGRDASYIHMNGGDVFKFAVKAIREGITAVLQEMDISMNEVDHVLCHQANARIIDHVRKRYRGHENKFYMNIDRYANTSAASIPIALDEMYEKQLLREGQRILCVGFGAGFTWSSVLFTI